MSNLDLIKAAEASIVTIGNRLLEDVYWLKSINAKKTPKLYVAVNLRNCIYYYSLEITCIEKAMLTAELPYVKRYHNKNLIANISEGFKALYNFGKLRKKSIWVKFHDVVAHFNIPIWDTKYQSLTNQLIKFEQTHINQQMRDIAMHYNEDMLRVYIETANFNSSLKICLYI